MRARFIKKKGETLIEVLISISIFAIVSIPLIMIVLSAITNNKRGENKQYAVAVAQQIIEQLRADGTTTPNIVTVKTDIATYDLKFPHTPGTSPGHDISYVVSNENVGNSFTANVNFERKLPYDSQTSNGVNYDLSIQMDKDSVIVTGTNSDGSTGDITYNGLTNDLKICNMADHTIQLKDNGTNNFLGTYTPTDGLVDNIKVSYKSDYGPHKITFENNAATSLSVYIFKQENKYANTYTNSSGSIKFYDNLSIET
ncbi:MAG: type II secretory pathway pseudopilin PulG, partial [Clostridium sp.]